jgi:hypothetical protein
LKSIYENPFRILGLPVNAKEREITKRINDLNTFSAIGKEMVYETDFPIFPPVKRTPDLVKEASSKIEQAENRLFYSFFWFSKTSSVDELTFEVLKEGKSEKAIELWEKILVRKKSPATIDLPEVVTKAALVNQILIPYLDANYEIKTILKERSKKQILRNSLGSYAEEILENLSDPDTMSYYLESDEPIGIDDNNEEMVLSCEITKDQFHKILNEISKEQESILTKSEFSHAKNLVVLYLGLSIQGKHKLLTYFDKGLALSGRIFYSSESLRNYSSVIAGPKYQFNEAKLAQSFIDEILTATKSITESNIFDEKMKEIVNSFRLFPTEFQQYAVQKLIKKPIKVMENKVAISIQKRKENPLSANLFGEELYITTHDDLLFLKDLLSTANLQYREIADEVADEIVSCSFDFFKVHRERDDDIDPGEDTLKLLHQADSIALNIRTKDRIQNGIPIIGDWIKDKPRRERQKKTSAHIKIIVEELEKLPEPEIALPKEIDFAEFFLNNCQSSLNTIKCLFENVKIPSKIIHEEFENNENNWSEAETDNFAQQIQKSQYLLNNKDKEKVHWSWAFMNLDFENSNSFSLECNILLLTGPQDTGFGIVWAYRKSENSISYFNFWIAGDGHYFIGKYNSGWVDGIEWKESPYVLKGNEINTLTVKKEGGIISYYINDRLVEKRGFVGSMKGTGVGFITNPGIAISINNLYFCNDSVSDFKEIFDYEYYLTISSVVARKVLDLCIAYANRTHDMKKPLKLMEKIKVLDMAPELMEHFTRNEEILKNNLEQEKIVLSVSRSKRRKNYAWAIILILVVLGIALSAILNNNSPQNQPQKTLPETSSVAPGPEPKMAPSPNLTVKPPLLGKPLPTNGSLKLFTEADCIAPFKIQAGQGNHYLLKLVDANTKASVMTIFIRSGSTIETKVPVGTYEVRYVSGDTWYGYKHLFGPSSLYSKADRLFEFEVQGEQVRGYTITLYQVVNGNLRTTAISPEEF